jgi:hypothetical protein
MMQANIYKSTTRAISRILVVAIFSSMLVGVAMPINSANASESAVGSVCFDNSSTASYINLNNSNNAIGTGDFTLEFWAKIPSTTGLTTLVNGHSVYNTASTINLYLDGNPGAGNGTIGFVPGGAITVPGNIPPSTWFHYAYVRSGTTAVAYLNGVPKTYTNQAVASVVDSNDYTSTNFRVGYPLTGTWPGGFTGCLAGVSLTKSALYSGNFSANLSSPVGPSIAAVMATISSRLAPISQISSEKTLVQLGADLATGTPVSGFTTPTAWNFSAESLIAGAWPRPFSVIT